MDVCVTFTCITPFNLLFYIHFVFSRFLFPVLCRFLWWFSKVVSGFISLFKLFLFAIASTCHVTTNRMLTCIDIFYALSRSNLFGNIFCFQKIPDFLNSVCFCWTIRSDHIFGFVLHWFLIDDSKQVFGLQS